MPNKNKALATGNSKGSDKSSSESRHTKCTTSETLWDAIDAFKQVLSDNGLGSPEIKPDVGIVRFKLPNEKGNNRSGWYTFHSGDIPACGYGNWKTSLNETWHYKKDNKPLTQTERAELAKVYAEAKKKRKQEQERKWAKARRISNSVWNNAKPAPFSHPYLIRKRCEGASKFLRVDVKNNLIVPLYNNKRLVSIQRINEKGGKWFQSGGQLSGSYFLFGDIKKPFDTAYIAEGISTSWIVHLLSDCAPCFVALNAGNLKPVGLSVRKNFPDITIIVAGDNDHHEDGTENIGVIKATECAQAIGGLVSIPQSPDGAKCDWNDLYLQCLTTKKKEESGVSQ